MEFVRKYVRDEKGIRIIKYETDEKVRKLIVKIHSNLGCRILLRLWQRSSFQTDNSFQLAQNWYKRSWGCSQRYSIGSGISYRKDVHSWSSIMLEYYLRSGRNGSHWYPSQCFERSHSNYICKLWRKTL